MRRSWIMFASVLLGMLAPVGPAAAEDPAPEQAVTLRVRADKSHLVVGEVIDATLEVRLRPGWMRRHAAPLFRQPLDLDAQISAPWLAVHDAAAVVPVPWVADPDAEERYVRVALNGEVTSLVQSATGTDGWATLSARCRLLPRRPGALELAPPSITFAYADLVEENLMGERSAGVTRPVRIVGEGLRVPVEALPDGAPAAFDGAVGQFAVEARVGTDVATVGEPFELTLVVSGRGNLGLVPQPRLDGVQGIHVFGAKEEAPEEPMPPRRIIRYEVAITDAALSSLPPLPFAYFDPASGYQVARTAPIALTVQSGAPEVVAEPAEGGPAPRTQEDREARERRPSPAFIVLGVLAGLVVIVGGGALLWRVRPRRVAGRLPRSTAETAGMAGRRSREDSPFERLALLTSALEGEGDDGRYAALVDYLGFALDRRPGAIVGVGLAGHLQRAGVPGHVTEETVAAMEELVQARYGGRGPVDIDPGLGERLHAALFRDVNAG